MRYATDQAFRTALEARLKRGKKDAGAISRARKRIVFERILARLVAQAPGDWVLKGGFALELRLGDTARSTKDADLEWQVDRAAADDLLQAAAQLDIGDHFGFDLARAREDTDLPGGGTRWRLAAWLAGRVFERAVVDVAYAAAPIHEPDVIATSGLLDFAGIQPVAVPAVAIEQHLAEKLHAYTSVYAGGRASTRAKDLVDMVVIANTTEVDARRLGEAIRVTFDRRGAHAPPPRLPPPPDAWVQPWPRLSRDVPVPDDLAAAHAAAAALFDPILDGSVDAGRWIPGVGWCNERTRRASAVAGDTPPRRDTP